MECEDPSERMEYIASQPSLEQQGINLIHLLWEVHNVEEGTIPKVLEGNLYHWEQESVKEVNTWSLRCRTFLSNPNTNRDQYRATIEEVLATGDFTADQKEVLLDHMQPQETRV
jgi:hypothetical protein